MAGLTGDAQFKGDNFQFLHEGGDTLRDASEIMVVHLLVLCRVVSHQGASRQQQVRTCGIETFVHQEILLFPSEVAGDLLHLRVEIMTDIRSSDIHCMKSTQQWCLVVECLTAVADEDRRDTQGVVDDEHR